MSGREDDRFVVADHYDIAPACQQTVHDSRAEHGIPDPIQPIDRNVAL